MIKEIQIEVSEAIGQAFDYCIKYHHDDFVLFLAHPELKKDWLELGKQIVLMDSAIDLLDSAYSSYLRDSFSHSEYAIDVNAKKIHLFNASRNKADKDDNIISFATFQQKFMKSIQLCYWLNHYIEMARLDYAKASVVTNPILIPDGRKMQVLAKIVGKEENMRARFDGIIIK